MRIHPGPCRPIMCTGQADFGEPPGKYLSLLDSLVLIYAHICTYMHSWMKSHLHRSYPLTSLIHYHNLVT